MLDYPEFYIAERGGRLVTPDSAFWNDLSEENSQFMEEVFLHPYTSETQIAVTEDEALVGDGLFSEDGSINHLALDVAASDTSTASTALMCSQVGHAKETTHLAIEGIHMLVNRLTFWNFENLAFGFIF